MATQPNTHVRAPNDSVKPKIVTNTYAGHRYTLRFDPNAPPNMRWHWTARITKTYEFTGTAATIKRAETSAKSMIEQMSEYMQTRA